MIVAKLNGGCLGGCGKVHPPYKCPNLTGDVEHQKKTLLVLAASNVIFLFEPLPPLMTTTMMLTSSICMNPTTKILIRIRIFHRADYLYAL